MVMRVVVTDNNLSPYSQPENKDNLKKKKKQIEPRGLSGC